MLTRKDITALLTPGLQTLFMQSETAVTPLFPTFTTEVSSNRASEDYGWLGENHGLKEWVDERQAHALAQYTFSIRNKDYEDTLAVDRNALDDDQYGQIKMRANTMFIAGRESYDELFTTTLEAGTTALAYDGQYFFDTDHSEGSSGTQSNYTSTGLALSAANAKTVITRMVKYKLSNGKPAKVMPTHIMVPPALQFTADEIFNPAVALGSTTVTDRSLAGKLKVIVNPYLTSDTAWYVLDLSKPVKPFIFQNRKPLTFAEDDTENFKRKKIYYGIEARFAFGYGHWKLAYKAVA
jgi:phage major head subunit gpT-like protein